MRLILHFVISFIAGILFFSCETDDRFNTPLTIVTPLPDDEDSNDNPDDENTLETIQILSLGDSYTAGTGVCDTCSYPEQLKDSLLQNLNDVNAINLNVIASAGWTTTSLLNTVNSVAVSYYYDVVTLLIGVNNQFQGVPFERFEEEFNSLIERATLEARNDVSNLVVLSIPDYAYTPFGQSYGNPLITSEEIDQYNQYIANYCEENSITFVDITDISREGLDNPNIVANDNLHLSEYAYSLIVERILPIVMDKLN